MSPAEHARADTLPEDAQAEQIAALLRAPRHLLIVDNAESITAAPAAIPHALSPDEQGRLKAFLARLRGGRTLVLIGSREPRGVADRRRKGQGSTRCPAWTPRPRRCWSTGSWPSHAATRWLADDRQREALQDLVTLLGGYPLPLTVVLPVLATVPHHRCWPSCVKALRRRPGRADHPGHRVQPRQARPRPAELAAAAGPVHRRHRHRPYPRPVPGTALREQMRSRRWTPSTWPPRSSRRSASGLAAPLPQLSYMVQVQPVLPWFLRSRLHGNPALAAAASQAHYQLYAASLAQALTVMLASRDNPQQRITGQAAAARSTRT